MKQPAEHPADAAAASSPGPSVGTAEELEEGEQSHAGISG